MGTIYVLIIVLLVLFIIYKFYYVSINNTNNKTQIIQTLVRQAARWSVASDQDENVLISVLHANYGAGYLWALRDIATDQEIYDATRIDVLQFRDAITQIQDNSTLRLAKLCPQYSPKQSYLTTIASEI